MKPTDELTLFITLRNPPHGGAVIVDLHVGTDKWAVAYHAECIDDALVEALRKWVHGLYATPYLVVEKERTHGRNGLRYRTCVQCEGRLHLTLQEVEVMRMRKGLPV